MEKVSVLQCAVARPESTWHLTCVPAGLQSRFELRTTVCIADAARTQYPSKQSTLLSRPHNEESRALTTLACLRLQRAELLGKLRVALEVRTEQTACTAPAALRTFAVLHATPLQLRHAVPICVPRCSAPGDLPASTVYSVYFLQVGHLCLCLLMAEHDDCGRCRIAASLELPRTRAAGYFAASACWQHGNRPAQTKCRRASFTASLSSAAAGRSM